MSTNQKDKNNEDEVDLGALFLIIGKGFTKFFNFIGSIFKGIFHGFISILIFFKSNIIPFTTSYTLFENLNLSILILFFKFFIKLFLSLLFFPINFLTTTYGKR
jgi:hypothetical protein